MSGDCSTVRCIEFPASYQETKIQYLHGFERSETSVVTDLIEFDNADDRLSVVVVVVDLMELDLDRAEDRLFDTISG